MENLNLHSRPSFSMIVPSASCVTPSERVGRLEEIRIGRYRHFKGRDYEVIGVASHSETLERMVVYRALYGEGGLWVRPASMWNETVERDGRSCPRFTYLGETDGSI